MKDTANVVIIGGGVVGASIAYHLAKAGCRDVLLVERDGIGSGSTSKGAGGIRQQFSTEVNIRLSLESVKMFQRFADEMECHAKFLQSGYLFLAATSEEMAALERNATLQRSLEVPVEIVTAEEAKRFAPRVNYSDIVGGTFCPTDGYSDPHEITQGYVQQARRMGVKLLTGAEVTAIKLERNAIRSVVTSRGEIGAAVVVNAAGPWAGLIGRMACVDLPIKPYRREIFVTKPFEYTDDFRPMIVDAHSGVYMRKEGPGILFGMSDENEPSSFNTSVNVAFLETIVEHALHRAPVLEKAQIMTGWAGLYDVTPDAHPILGWVPEVKGLVCAAGFSGHGFMHSPIVGKLIAETVLEGKASTVDITSLSIERFRTGDLIKEATVI